MARKAKKQIDLLEMLRGGDRRSIGRSDQVAGMVSVDLRLFSRLMEGLWSQDELVRMRAADAAEKVTRDHRELLRPYKRELVGLLAETEQQELRWHLAAIIPRLELRKEEREFAIGHLKRYLEDRSSIVRTFALEGLVELSREDAKARVEAVEILREALRMGSTAMKARSRKLLVKIEKIEKGN